MSALIPSSCACTSPATALTADLPGSGQSWAAHDSRKRAENQATKLRSWRDPVVIKVTDILESIVSEGRIPKFRREAKCESAATAAW